MKTLLFSAPLPLVGIDLDEIVRLAIENPSVLLPLSIVLLAITVLLLAKGIVSITTKGHYQRRRKRSSDQ